MSHNGSKVGIAESRYELLRNWNIPEFEIMK
jgi:hypothetical protein